MENVESNDMRADTDQVATRTSETNTSDTDDSDDVVSTDSSSRRHFVVSLPVGSTPDENEQYKPPNPGKLRD
jgi:hypothetical protein